MKQNKWTILISFPITIVALIVAWYMDKLEIDFWCNVLLGIFGSGLLTFVVAVINYVTERRKALEAYWVLGHKAARAFNKYPLDGNPEEKIEAILLINEFDFAALGDAYAAIDFLFGNKRVRKKIYSEIHKPVRYAGYTIADSASNIARLRRALPGNLKALETYISNVDKKLIKTEVCKHEGEDGCEIKMTYTCNRMTELCYEQFNGFYWKAMYPLKKHEEAESE